MFEGNYQFHGKHAIYVKMLTNEFEEGKLFETFVDLYTLAAIVGFVYDKRGKRDVGSEKANILAEQLTNRKNQIVSNYRMIMLLYDKENVDINERINRAFRYDNNKEKRKVCDEIYDSFVLGGLEKIFEKVFETLDVDRAELDIEKEAKNFYSFIDEFETRYETKKTDMQILDLCKLAYD